MNHDKVYDYEVWYDDGCPYWGKLPGWYYWLRDYEPGGINPSQPFGPFMTEAEAEARAIACFDLQGG